MRLLTPYFWNVVYTAALVLVSPFLLWQAATKGKYRDGFREKLLGLVPRCADGAGPCLWLHGVSVGEINLLVGLVRAIEAAHPDWRCVISTTTRTGMELARKRFPGHTVFYCPMDFSWAVRNAMKRIRPGLLVLGELELWPNMVRAARESNVKIAVVNGRLSENSYRGYVRFRPLLCGMFQSLGLVAAQDETYAHRFASLGAPAESVHVSGSMKFDGAETDRDNERTRELRTLAHIADDDVVFLAGSTQSPEEAAAIEVFRSLSSDHPALRLIIVPRHPHRFDEVAGLLEASGLPWRRRSDLPSDGDAQEEPRILLVDTVGELGAWWGAAHIAFVGGSWGSRGGQNMIEPAAYGAAVSFGPNTKNFRDIVALLLDGEAAIVVEDEQSLTRFVERCLADVSLRRGLGERAKQLVRQQLGATDRTIELLAELLKDAGSNASSRTNAA